jgi:hypothetical protein
MCAHHAGGERQRRHELGGDQRPHPGGATILGSGLGRDSQIATQGEKRSGAGWPAFEERSFEVFRSYYEYLPKGTVKLEYTVRLNNVGNFALPPTRVEAMYAPEMFGEAPNARVVVEAAGESFRAPGFARPDHPANCYRFDSCLRSTGEGSAHI